MTAVSKYHLIAAAGLVLALMGACSGSNFAGANKIGAARDGGKDGEPGDASTLVPVGDTKNVLDLPGIGPGGKEDDDDKSKIEKIESADPSIAKVDDKGNIKGIAPGKTKVKITFSDGTTQTVSVTVPKDGEADSGSDSAGGVDAGDSDGADSGVDSSSGDSLGKVVEDKDKVDSNGLNQEEAELVAKLPGVEVIRAGVNFEDRGLEGDRDYNDAVLCFEGKFKVDDSNVVSTRSQTVTGTTSSISGCHHQVTVVVVHKDGKKDPPITYDSRSKTPVTMSFRVGSKLEVTMVSNDGMCHPGVTKNMHSATDCKVLPNLCNTTGN